MKVKIAKGTDHAIGGRLASGGPLGLSGSPRSPFRRDVTLLHFARDDTLVHLIGDTLIHTIRDETR